jgi:hypothetical protein
MVKIDSAIEGRCQGKAADLAFSEEKPTNEMVRRLILLREQVDRGGSF